MRVLTEEQGPPDAPTTPWADASGCQQKVVTAVGIVAAQLQRQPHRESEEEAKHQKIANANHTSA